MSALEQIEALRENIESAKANLSEKTAARRASSRALKEAETRLSDYYSTIAAGEAEPDPKREHALLKEMQTVRAATSVRVSESGDLEATDLKAAAEEDGATYAVSRAEAALSEFYLSDAENIAAELAGRAQDVETATREALTMAANAHHRWGDLDAAWSRMNAVLADAGRDLGPLPPAPFQGVDLYGALGNLEAPIPQFLAESLRLTEGEFIHSNNDDGGLIRD